MVRALRWSPSGRSPAGLQTLGVAAFAAALVAAGLVLLISPLNGNLRYEAGVKQAGSYSAVGTFSHRPLAFRILADGVFRLARAVSVGTVSFELAVRLLFAALAVASGLLLWRGLRARGVGDPGLHAAVVVAATLLLTPISVGEPDWLAVPVTAAGVGLALLGRSRRWPWALAAAGAFVVAADLKIVTVCTAALGLGVVAVVDRRPGDPVRGWAQALRVVAGCLLLGAGLLAATAVWAPHELQWLLDLRTVQKDPGTAAADGWAYFASLAADHPVLVLLPAAWLLAEPRERVATAVGLAVTVGSIVAQGQYFVYHAAGLVTVATLAVFRSLRGRVTTAAGAGIAALAVAAAAFTAVSRDWAADHQRLWGGLLVALALLAIALVPAAGDRAAGGSPAGRPAGRPPGRSAAGSPAGAAALAAVALLLPASTPWAAHLLRAGAPEGPLAAGVLADRTRDEAVAAEVRRAVGGPGVPVTYLTFGEWSYFVGNPTDCRYPSPLFLQRRGADPQRQAGTRSYRENLACLDAPGSRWLVWDPAWFSVAHRPAPLRAALARSWDCAAAVPAGPLRLCPRRS